MELTPENKAAIDSKSHHELLFRWRFGETGDAWMQGETGKYWGERLGSMSDIAPEDHTRISKSIGW